MCVHTHTRRLWGIATPQAFPSENFPGAWLVIPDQIRLPQAALAAAKKEVPQVAWAVCEPRAPESSAGDDVLLFISEPGL